MIPRSVVLLCIEIWSAHEFLSWQRYAHFCGCDRVVEEDGCEKVYLFREPIRGMYADLFRLVEALDYVRSPVYSSKIPVRGF